MAKQKRPYGERWRITTSLGGGGQGEVFRAIDETGVLSGEYALKRLKDIGRIDRFNNEIVALESLRHEKIIQLIDHSDFSSENVDRPFLVMPIASEGDAEKRRPLFQGSIENVARVAAQVAEALSAAHSQGIIHRDIKPSNILFPNQGFDIWLTDFGICRLEQGAVRTPEGVIMGPRRFAAPEIEAGQTQDVHPSVDIYSLGQTIFYLLSDGRTFHREDVNSDNYNIFFPAGERGALLRSLLSDMVAVYSNRIKKIDEVIERIKYIQNWSSEAYTGVVSNALQNALLQAREDVRESNKKFDDQERMRALYVQARGRALDLLKSSIVDQLEPASNFARQGAQLDSNINIEEGHQINVRLGRMRVSGDFNISFSLSRASRVEQVASLILLISSKTRFKQGSDETREDDVSILPVVRYRIPGTLRVNYFVFSEKYKQVPLIAEGGSYIINTRDMFGYQRTPAPDASIKVAMLQFELSAWPGISAQVRTFVDEISVAFVTEARKSFS